MNIQYYYLYLIFENEIQVILFLWEVYLLIYLHYHLYQNKEAMNMINKKKNFYKLNIL